MMVVQTCRHCKVRPAKRARRLCHGCYHTPELRGLYRPVTFPEVGAGNHQRELPAEPTDARPGSREKLAVLIWRAEREELLHHPLDRRDWDG